MKIEHGDVFMKSSAWRMAKRTIPFVVQFRRKIYLILSLTVFIALLDAAEPILMKLLFDSLGEYSSVRTFAAAAGALVALGVGRQGVAGILNVLFWRVRIGVNYNIQQAVVNHLYNLPLSFFRKETVGGIVNKMNRGIGGYVEAFSELITKVLSNLIYLCFSLVTMFMLDWHLFLLALAFAPLPTLIGAWAAREQTERERSVLTRWTRIYSRFNEVLGGITIVKSFTRETAERQAFMKEVDETNHIVLRGVRRDTSIGAATGLIIVLGRIATAAYGGYLVIQGKITIGTVIAFLSYMGGLFGPVQGLTGTYQTLRRATVYLGIIFDILDAPEPSEDEPEAREIERIQGQVDFVDVTFAYSGRDPVLKNIDLSVQPGETVALVGPSGAGKTTLMSLLQRFDDPTSGAIFVDGTDIRTLKRKSLRSNIGFVLQENLLFNDTVLSNIAYGRPEASLCEIEAVSRAASAHEFITALPQGYQTQIGEGGKCLSCGQRQRIAIARALLKNPPVLILDEATSALDSENEMLVQRALAELMKGRTTFIIAHRLHTIVNADRIVLIRDGRVADIGSHSELYNNNRYYRSLVSNQTDGLTARHLQAA